MLFIILLIPKLELQKCLTTWTYPFDLETVGFTDIGIIIIAMACRAITIV